MLGLWCATSKGNQQCSCIKRCSPVCKHAAIALAVMSSMLPSVRMLQEGAVVTPCSCPKLESSQRPWCSIHCKLS